LGVAHAASGESVPLSECKEQVAPSGPLKFLAGGRPPYVEAQGRAGGSGQDGDEPRPPDDRHFWTLSPLYCGDPKSGVVLDYGPAFHDECQAMDWIAGGVGSKWVRESSNYFLMAFIRTTAPSPAGTALLPVQRMKGQRPKSWGYFPCADWETRFSEIGCTLPPVELLDFGALELEYPPDGDLGDECRRLRTLQPLQRGLEEKIRTQAQSDLHAIQPVLDELGLNLLRPPHTALLQLRDLIQQNILHAVFLFKREVLRDRPWNGCDAALQPMFLRPDRLYPGHPSYPSGHATLAYTWAALLSELFPGKANRLEQAADEVAMLREVAGVHFRSDSEAGRLLGKQIAAGILRTLRGHSAESELRQALECLETKTVQ